MPSAVLAQLHDDSPHKDDQNIVTFQFKGYVILLGRNAFSNERLISEHPHRTCLWMHALAARGSHVVLCLNSHPEVPDEVIQYAAHVALKNSHSEARTVAVSLLRDVFKPEGHGIGVWKSSKQTSVEVP